MSTYHYFAAVVSSGGHLDTALGLDVAGMGVVRLPEKHASGQLLGEASIVFKSQSLSADAVNFWRQIAEFLIAADMKSVGPRNAKQSQKTIKLKW